MSFRLFIWYCALCGAWAGLFGWVLGKFLGAEDQIANAGIKGFCLGLFIAMAISAVDALWNVSLGQLVSGAMRVVVALLVGSFGGMIGAVIGQALYGAVDKPNPDDPNAVNILGQVFIVFGWTFMGFLIGTSIGVYEVMARFVRQEDIGGALRKIMKGTLGGTLGGILGGIITVAVRLAWNKINSTPGELLWSPTSIGMVALGMCIGLLIGMAQILLKEAWIKVETGRRAGKEMLLSKKEFTIGRAEACDLGLFGDMTIEKMHARIIQNGNRYFLADLNTPSGTFLNGHRINGPSPLKNGDAIRVGGCTLRFGERAKRN
jgi:hypothetical protein